MVEIEIKAKLTKDDFFLVRDKLNKISTFVKESEQTDEYLMPAHRNFLEPEFPFEWLSIRARDGKTILNYKHWYPENSEIATHCDEFETEISNTEQLAKILSALNFGKLVAVNKRRETYMYNGEFEIALDTVKDLGYFIEIESKKDFNGVEETRKRIFAVAETLGIDVSSLDKRGYPYALMKKKGLL